MNDIVKSLPLGQEASGQEGHVEAPNTVTHQDRRGQNVSSHFSPPPIDPEVTVHVRFLVERLLSGVLLLSDAARLCSNVPPLLQSRGPCPRTLFLRCSSMPDRI